MLVFYSRSLPASNPDFWVNYWAGVNEKLETIDVFRPEYNTLRQFVPPGSTVLDAGCGMGLGVRALNRRGYKAYGADFNQESLIQAARNFGYVPAIAGDVTQLPYRDNTFDAVFLSGVAEHVPVGAGDVVVECSRTLKCGGKLVVTITYVNFLRKLYSPFYKIWEKTRPSGTLHFDQYIYTRKEVMDMMRRGNLRVLLCHRSHYMTVLFRIPGVERFHEWVFSGEKSTDVAVKAGGQSSEPKKTKGLKLAVKTVLEAILNGIFANRLTVVAEKIG